jgi:hypothetical protein
MKADYLAHIIFVRVCYYHLVLFDGTVGGFFCVFVLLFTNVMNVLKAVFCFPSLCTTSISVSSPCDKGLWGPSILFLVLLIQLQLICRQKKQNRTC